MKKKNHKRICEQRLYINLCTQMKTKLTGRVCVCACVHARACVCLHLSVYTRDPACVVALKHVIV